MKTSLKFSLLLIFLLALGMRFYKISKVPASLNWDEAAFAYNAYSILETGKDEYGYSFPLEFKSVGDYKCPLFVYLSVPVIKYLGLNEFSIRFLSSFFGALTVVVFFMLVKELFNDDRLSVLSGIILSISPWHLQFTRAQGDVAISSFLVILGIWQFLAWVKGGKKASIFVSIASFALSFYAYFSERFFVPVLALLFVFIFRKEILEKRKTLVPASFLGLVLLFPLISTMVSSGQKSKILMTTIFGYRRPAEYLSRMLYEDHFPILFKVFHHPLVEYPWMTVDRYLNHFSPKFLFIEGPKDDRQRIEGMGMLYWSDAVLLVLALASIAGGIKKRKELFFVMGWLSISPLPSIITRDPVHARRAFNMVYPLCIILAIGMVKFIDLVRQKKGLIKIFLSSFFFLLFAWSFSFYLLSYYVFTPPRTAAGPGGWNYGYKELVEYVSPLKENYNKVVIDTSYQGPYLFFLFYEKYPPLKYQPQAQLVKKNEFSLGEGKGYDSYEFRDIYWPKDRGLKNTLFAGSPERLPLQDIDPKEARIIKKIYFPDGREAFYVVETF
ncbi:phospholipid carrier-dependent glycosyltransferase [Candidatus Microgenomates bacterium]|jgi:4-amino-4-deoxy-L-arabinose transferase-like glycosyltransferase|nr:MAG: phospholipid carrier-dependent glycosyltransferase [Candidatus Microgenomates bacterium]